MKEDEMDGSWNTHKWDEKRMQNIKLSFWSKNISWET
jgi:hypothetical protein